MKGSGFVFNYVHLLYCKYHKTNLSCSGSYINSPDWINNNKNNNKINPINKKDSKCFQYHVTVTLYHEDMKKDPQGITKILERIKIFHQKNMIGKNLKKYCDNGS